MQRRPSFFRWLTAGLLISILGVGILGGAGLSVRAAPEVKPLAVCPDPTIAQWTFTGAVAPTIPPPSTGAGTLVAGPDINGPTYPTGQTASENPAISFTGWNSVGLNQDDYLEFQIDTSSMNSISLSSKSRVSNTGPTSLELHYSIDGGTSFILYESPTTLSNDESWNLLNFDFSSISDINDNSDVRFRFYAYGASGGGGTWRLDNITFSAVCPPPPGTILISEVAWAGTAANTDHEWIELRNPGAAPVDITGWRLQAADGNPNIPLSGTIPAGGFFLLERNEDAVADVMANQLYDFNNTLSNSGEMLILYDKSGTTVIDTANSNGGSWPAGSTTMHASMERIGNLPDGDNAWFTNNGVMKNGIDADGNPIWGTPKGQNSLTPTPIPPPTLTPAPTSPLTIVISEVAWAGTQSSSDDEWIELYNPGTKNINLTGWNLRSTDGSPNIDTEFDGIILRAGDYLLLERTDDDPTDVDADIIYTGSLSNTGEILRLYDSNGYIVDTANSNGGAWPAGIASSYSSMQRSLIATDSNFVWVTYNPANDTNPNITKAKDASGNVINGTPGRGNTPFNVTATPTPGSGGSSGGSGSGGSGTVTLPPILGISEFLPRPGYDWNNDGVVDVFDEFIEIINAGQIDVNLSAYRLDDEQNLGSVPYTLPAITLQPGERAVFYASETGILLSDAGDTVRLLRGSSTVVDAYTYGVVRYPDQSWCRIPDRLGYWNDPCFPTPGNPNALTGNFPLPSDGPTGYLPSVCLLPDTTPKVFVYAECEVGGDKIWSRRFWDKADETKHVTLDYPPKWKIVFE